MKEIILNIFNKKESDYRFINHKEMCDFITSMKDITLVCSYDTVSKLLMTLEIPSKLELIKPSFIDENDILLVTFIKCYGYDTLIAEHLIAENGKIKPISDSKLLVVEKGIHDFRLTEEELEEIEKSFPKTFSI